MLGVNWPEGVAFAAMAIVLGVALGYGLIVSRRRPRDPQTERRRDEATRRNYDRSSG